MCVSACMFAYVNSGALGGKNRVSDPLRLKLTDGCESPDESQELNAGSLKEHQVLSTTELSLHLISIFKWFYRGKVSFCSRQQLRQRWTAGQSARNKRAPVLSSKPDNLVTNNQQTLGKELLWNAASSAWHGIALTDSEQLGHLL